MAHEGSCTLTPFRTLHPQCSASTVPPRGQRTGSQGTREIYPRADPRLICESAEDGGASSRSPVIPRLGDSTSGSIVWPPRREVPGQMSPCQRRWETHVFDALAEIGCTGGFRSPPVHDPLSTKQILSTDFQSNRAFAPFFESIALRLDPSPGKPVLVSLSSRTRLSGSCGSLRVVPVTKKALL